jgi:ATP-dependent Zn protease
MKNVFLLAKYYAYKSNKKTIGISELRQSSIKLSFAIKQRKSLVDLLEKELHIVLEDKPSNNNTILEIIDNINQVKQLDSIKFTQPVKKILLQLNEHGYYIKEEIISLDIEEDKEIDDDMYLFDLFEETDYYGQEDDSIDEDMLLQESDPLEIAINLKDTLSQKIYGQDLAIDAVVDSIKNKVVKSTDMPEHTFLFLGPPATGKTYLSKILSESFDDYAFLELSMTEFQNHNDGMKIFGTEKGWSTASNGVLTSFVKNNSKCVVLLDEFEKAHTNIQKKLLPIFSEGYLNDANGWTPDGETFDSSESKHKIDEIVTKVDFSETIIVITSNLGTELYNNHEFLECLDDDYRKAETMILQSLQTETKKEANEEISAIIPEMLSRLSQGKIVLFNKLSFNNLFKISQNIFDEKINEIENKFNINYTRDDTTSYILQCLLLQFAPYLDVRRIKSKIYENFTDIITDKLLEEKKLWKDIDIIKTKISNQVRNFIDNEITTYANDQTLTTFLFRKNYTVKVSYSTKINDKEIIVSFDNVEFQKIKKVEDIVGTGALSFSIPETNFDTDIAGHDEVKGRLKEIANLLKNPQALKRFNAKIPKGMLLYGVPGTGKTMLAKAFANYADLPFIETTANDLIDVSNNNLDMIKSVFKRAKDYAPSIIFIDEIDTFGSRNKNGSKAVINELLTQINGFSDNIDESVFIIAATNNKNDIDDAILRPGRIELHIEIPTLNTKGRKYFIEKILKSPCEENIDISKLVMYTAGMTGAQLEKIANESSLYVIRHGLKELTQKIIIEQINIEKYGKRVTNKSIEDELDETAYHEAGHAIISKILMPDIKIEQITVTPREDTLGFVSYDLSSASSSLSKKDIENKICVAYAGRVAQMKQFNDDGFDTGASSDLAQVTRLCFAMVAHFGMDKEFGEINIDGIPNYQKETIGMTDTKLFNTKIENRVLEISKLLKQRTDKLVDIHWDKIDNLAKQLLKKEVIHEEELNEIVDTI